MFGYRGGEKVRPGTYWSLTRGETVVLPPPGAALPGGHEELYIQARTPLMLLLGPLAGLAYVIFLPLLGFATVAAFLAQRGWHGVKAGGRVLVESVAGPAWVPGMARLTRRPARQAKSGAKAETTTRPDELAALEEEVKAKRRNEG